MGESHFPRDLSAMRLNLGCGPHTTDGWVNIDRSPNVLIDRIPCVKSLLFRMKFLSKAHMESWSRDIVRLDVTKGLPYADCSVEAIYSSHMLEHLFFEEAQCLLRECHRVLARSGVLRLALPNTEQLARDLLSGVSREGRDPGMEFNEGLYAHPFQRPTRRELIVSMLGGNIHRWQPTPSLVEHLLRRAGFSDIRHCAFRQGSLPDLESIEFRAESLFVEAFNPLDR